MSNIDALIEAAREDQAAADAEIAALRLERRAINTKIKELTARKVRTSRIVRASQPRSRKASGNGGSE